MPRNNNNIAMMVRIVSLSQMRPRLRRMPTINRQKMPAHKNGGIGYMSPIAKG